MPNVPLELSDYIIDFLHKDARTLAVCARVCRAWTPASRFHLFRSIVLQNHHFTTSFQRLLKTTPDLGYYVRELTVAKFVTPSAVFRPAKLAPSVEDTLPRVLAHLPHLRSLTLAHIDLKSVAELSALHHPSLTEATFSFCQFADFADLVDLVSSFPSLAKLSIAGLTWKEELRVPVAKPLPALRTLALGRELDAERLFEWLVAAGLHTSITSLAVRCASERDTDLVGPFLTLAGPALHSLDLDWSFSGDKNCTALESLRLQFPVHYSASLPWIVSLLETLEAPTLRALALDIRLLGGLASLDWDGLNGVLAAPAYASLGALGVGVNLWPGVHRDMAEVEGIVRERLAPFGKRGGVLQCSKI
ncbi:hypothetical protein TRAPUB_6346 [Trametes pubescens]|uniref:F-box domain-containing protein n=1 Tax=Trametes pubescens TaxID=154538 RepID=A0A1M2V5Z1_TRAPU|nr:hypothetical protein TRAPUB_6346 [Trametes pubescens]